MSERLIWAALGSIILLLVFSLAAILGNRQGRAEMKRWQDDWYHGHWAIAPLQIGDSIDADIVQSCLKLSGQWNVVGEGPHPLKGYCSITVPVLPPPKPKKGSKDADYLRGYRDATNYCLARMKELHKQFREYRALVEAQPIPEKEPAPQLPQCVIMVPSPAMTWPPDESAEKAKCEKGGGYWDHMDGTSCYATNPEICSSHCDPKMSGVPAETKP